MSDRLFAAGIVILIILSLATTGLAAPAKGTTTVSVTIMGGISLEIKDGANTLNFGSIPGSTQPDLTQTVTLVVQCNDPPYTISFESTSVLRDGIATAEITRDNFSISGAGFLYSGPLVPGPQPIVHSANLTPTGGLELPVSLRFHNLTGAESPGNYSTTLTFTGQTI